eukprot:gene29416-51411_t
MEYVNLGRTGLKVSRLTLGCMTYGVPDRGGHEWTLDEEQSRPVIRHALEAGINFFDTANSYSDGTSEEIVGRALRDFARRDEVVIATNGYTTELTPTLRRKVVPVASHIIATEELPEDLVQSLIPKNRVVSDTKRVLCYYRQSPDNKR